MIDFPICQADVPADNIMYMSEREAVGNPWPQRERDTRIDTERRADSDVDASTFVRKCDTKLRM